LIAHEQTSLLMLLVALAFVMGSGASFVLMLMKVGYNARGFVDAQIKTAEALREIAKGFNDYVQQQTVFNERLENAIEVMGGRVSDIEKEMRRVSS